MGILKVVYDVTSNKTPKYTDDPDESSGEDTLANDNGQVEHDGDGRDLEAISGRPDAEDGWPGDGGPSGWRHTYVYKYIPDTVKRFSAKVTGWVKGPKPPRPWKITPFFPKIQTFPIRLLDRWFPKRRHKWILLFAFYFCWLFCFSTMLHYSAFTDEVPGYGAPAPITCDSTFFGAKNKCGLNGNDCRPFNGSALPFRCPASCLKTIVFTPHAVGAQEVNYMPLVVGGPSDPRHSVETAVYRGDSFVCAAAIHAGFITNDRGGCGVAETIGTGIDYPASRQHTVQSVGFDSSFPISFRFLPETTSNCKDLRWPMLAMDVTFSAVLSVFTYSSALFFSSIFASLFFHTALVSDPANANNYYELVSRAVGGFLPAAFVAYALYRFAIRKTLKDLRAQFEKTVLWLGPCWVGCLNNYTFDKIPIQRLTYRDLTQPGAIVALVIIVLVIFIIMLGQAWAIRVEGLMPRYLGIYGLFVFCLLMLVAVPHLDLRIHHYFLAMLLIPGTYIQTRPSLVYQGLLVGLFINGMARWGFASIMETPGSLQGEGQYYNTLPMISWPQVDPSNTMITFDMGLIPFDYDSISVLVNDVERHRSYTNVTTTWTWLRDVDDHPEYFRFGYMNGRTTYDYTKAGIWEANGTWIPMASGPSK